MALSVWQPSTEQAAESCFVVSMLLNAQCRGRPRPRRHRASAHAAARVLCPHPSPWEAACQLCWSVALVGARVDLTAVDPWASPQKARKDPCAPSQSVGKRIKHVCVFPLEPSLAERTMPIGTPSSPYPPAPARLCPEDLPQQPFGATAPGAYGATGPAEGGATAPATSRGLVGSSSSGADRRDSDAGRIRRGRAGACRLPLNRLLLCACRCWLGGPLTISDLDPMAIDVGQLRRRAFRCCPCAFLVVMPAATTAALVIGNVAAVRPRCPAQRLASHPPRNCEPFGKCVLGGSGHERPRRSREREREWLAPLLVTYRPPSRSGSPQPLLPQLPPPWQDPSKLWHRSAL